MSNLQMIKETLLTKIYWNGFLHIADINENCFKKRSFFSL